MRTLIYLGLSLMIMAGSTLAARVPVSLVYVHYSLGWQIVISDIGGQELCDIIDTMTVTYSSDTADIVFRDYHLNYWSTGPLSDTTSGCEDYRFPGFGYDLRSPSYDRTKIMEARYNVIVENIQKDERLNTEELFWDQNSNKIYSNKFVKITRGEEVLTGDGLVSDQNFDNIEIVNLKGLIEVEDDEDSAE